MDAIQAATAAWRIALKVRALVASGSASKQAPRPRSHAPQAHLA